MCSCQIFDYFESIGCVHATAFKSDLNYCICNWALFYLFYFIQLVCYVRMSSQADLLVFWTYLEWRIFFYSVWYFFISSGIILVSHIHFARLFFINKSRLVVVSLPNRLNGEDLLRRCICLYSNWIHYSSNRYARAFQICVAFFFLSCERLKSRVNFRWIREKLCVFFA